MWITSKNLIREVFDGSFLKFEERPNVAPDQTNCIILASVANDPQYTDDTLTYGTRPYARDITVTMHWIAHEDDYAQVETALDNAYHSAGEQIIGKFGSDITGVDRVTQEITPFPEQEQLLVGTEIWNFSR